MYISCTFHVVCAPFSALATRKSADAKADSSGIQALDVYYNRIHIVVQRTMNLFLFIHTLSTFCGHSVNLKTQNPSTERTYTSDIVRQYKLIVFQD